eukprot:gnl/TRDRNA2_/TRDRNA2_130274_c0_seq3.p1 gnl/TRDRNA2_/TRDRNA2_130274_c0~~gnl/TRDRNA2_/TRDRNA2_130274_c0_seq3.p1  ORF type:complete len:373 (-),score=51.61 gnl/TRDRNA2_/TRDRNA2_130274_c0_seq3:97-1152(-)
MDGQNREERLLGQTEGDANMVFPKFTSATAVSPSDVTVNGKVVKIWNFAQLENLSVLILRQRAATIRDAVGEQGCPPMPSMQRNDVIRWILHMQSELTQAKNITGRMEHGVPSSFQQEIDENPILPSRPTPKAAGQPAPFGPRKVNQGHGSSPTVIADKDSLKGVFDEEAVREANARDTYEYQNDPSGKKQTRSEMLSKHQMLSFGVSDAGVQGIQTMKPNGEGRRVIPCKNNMAEIFSEAPKSGYPIYGIQSGRPGGEGRVYIAKGDQMACMGMGAPEKEPHIGGERRKHNTPEGHMVTTGTSEETQVGHGRRYVDHFKGPGHGHRGEESGYNQSWKKDPSRLLGASMII